MQEKQHNIVFEIECLIMLQEGKKDKTLPIHTLLLGFWPTEPKEM